jgi:mRNA deadenylase 3'-5' endonuclease subunit Ccr4
MAELNINWARVIFDNLQKSSSKTLHHGCFLTTIFRHFNVNLLMEGLEILPHLPYFDRTALSRMSLPYDPADSDQEQQGDSDQEEEEEEEGEEEHQQPQSPQPQAPQAPQQYPPYDDLCDQVQRLSTTQDRLVASHYVMQYQLSSIRENQEEMLRRFNEQFPPPQ